MNLAMRTMIEPQNQTAQIPTKKPVARAGEYPSGTCMSRKAMKPGTSETTHQTAGPAAIKSMAATPTTTPAIPPTSLLLSHG